MKFRFLSHPEWTFCATLLFAACKDAPSEDEGDDGSTSAAATNDDAESSTAPATDADTTAAQEEGTTFSTDEGMTESTGAAPSGDVWVDAEGTVIGLYRVTTGDYDEAVEGLVDSTDATWRVFDDRMSIGAIDTYGIVYWESTDCTGPRYFAEPGNFDPFREGIVSRVSADFEDVFFAIPPGTERVEITFASWWDAGFGCDAQGPDGFDDPTTFYAETDVMLATPPAFVPPLTIEHL